MKKNKIDLKKREKVQKVVDSFRAKLRENGQSLTRWYDKNLAGVCRYDYFIRQINNVDLLRADVLGIIEKYIK